MRAGSLFSGIGGLDLGFDRAGIASAYQCENDPACVRVLKRHFPHVQRIPTVEEAVARADELPRVELVHGGFPCQDLSLAGHRAGLAGERSGLFHAFMAVVAATTPRWVLLENVAGLLSSNGGRDMGAVLGSLAQHGYGYAYRVLDAQHFGVAQRRRRVFIVGCLGDGRSAASVLLEPESRIGHLETRRRTGPNAAGPLGGGAYGTGRRSEDDPNVVATINSGGNNGGFRTEPGEHLVAALSRNGVGASGPDDNQAQAGHLVPFDTTQVTSRENRSNPQPGDPCHTLSAGAHAPAVAMRQREGKPGGGKGLLFSAERSLALSSSNDQTVFEAARVRRLTPVECERLQGFPDDWTAGVSESIRYRMIGNAVCVPVAHWLARRIAACERTGSRGWLALRRAEGL